MPSLRSITLLLSIPVLLQGAAACSRGSSASKIDPITGAPVVEIEKLAPKAKTAPVSDPFLRSQTDAGLSARIEGNRLHVEVTNKTARPFLAGPKNFAVRPAGMRQLLKFNSREPGFPAGAIQPGETRAGVLPLPAGADRLAGARVIFNHPDLDPAMAPIRAAEPEPR